MSDPLLDVIYAARNYRRAMRRYAARKSETMSVAALRVYATERGFIYHVDCEPGHCPPHEVLTLLKRKMILRAAGEGRVFLAFRDPLIAALIRLNYGTPVPAQAA
jgi:hypothetical protein